MALVKRSSSFHKGCQEILAGPGVLWRVVACSGTGRVYRGGWTTYADVTALLPPPGLMGTSGNTCRASSGTCGSTRNSNMESLERLITALNIAPGPP